MTDYIKRGDALKVFDTDSMIKAWHKTEFIPSADVAPVVRCKDCKFYDTPKHFKKPYCVRGAYVKVGEDDYCSKGERRGQ